MKKRFVKRLIGLAGASIILLSSVLTGCGNAESGSDQSQVQEEGSSGTEESGETPVLTVWAYWTNSDLYSDQGDWE